MRIGIDLDNTLVSYDAVFLALAREKGIGLGLTEASVPPSKKTIRDAVRAAAGNDVWTELQGLAYGPRMKDARMMPGAEDFLRCARERGAELFVVSHKTRQSAAGGHDLHAPALEWLRSHGVMSRTGAGSARSGAGKLDLGLKPGEGVFLEETKDAKFARIASLRLTHFIDDLEEFLRDPAFPASVEKWHFAPESGAGKSAPADPDPRRDAKGSLRTFGHWRQILDFFEQEHR